MTWPQDGFSGSLAPQDKNDCNDHLIKKLCASSRVSQF